MHPPPDLRRIPRRGAVVLALAICLGFQPRLGALETDQYYAWGQPLADATGALNAKFNLELERAIGSFERPPSSCLDIEIRFRKRLRYLLIHPIQVWVMHTSLVARIPADGEESVEYPHANMYRLHGLLDPGMWMPITSTIEVNGVRFGTDKLSHFVSSGWTFFATRQKALNRGLTDAEAVRAAVQRGIVEERLILGSAASGIFSIADMEANLQGMRLYVELCSGGDPILANDGSGWSIRRPIDLRGYVHPGWDESYRNSIFTHSRWKKVEPALKQYCALRDDPWVTEMLSRYRERDRRTPVQEAIEALVAEGRLPDPAGFSLDAACGAADGNVGHDAEPRPMPAEAPPPGDLVAAIIAEERSAERRTIPIAALRLAYPQVASLSYGLLLTRQPADYDCRTPCDMWGGFAQVEPGIGGGKASVGWGRVIGEQRRGRPFLSSAYLATAAKATVLRTWGGESPLPANQSYVGAEFEFSVARVNMGVGTLYRVSGSEGRDWVLTGSMGWGF